MSNCSRSKYNHKTNIICPIKGCNYHSRKFIVSSSLSVSQKNSVSSTKCPIHQVELVNVGSNKSLPIKNK